MSQDQAIFPARTVPVAEAHKQDDKWQVGKFTFRADFDSANLHSARQGSSSAEVQLWTRRDCQGTVNERGTRTWFHFGVAGQSAGDWLALNIMNINQQAKLYGQEYRPWYWCASMADWQPIPNKVIYKREGEDFQLRFAFKFESAEEVFFAFAIPFSYRENQVLLDHITYMHRNHQTVPHSQQGQANTEGGSDGFSLSGANAGRIYFKRQLLARSIEGRDVDLITITDCYGASSECESMPPAPHREAPPCDEPLPCRLAMSAAGEAPRSPSGAKAQSQGRRSVQSCSGPSPGVERHSSSPVPLFPSKKVFVITARVHPGETPATHLFNGMLAFLLRPHDARAAALRRMFVFKLVPLVNPDGVFHGHYRTDTLGQNLNRFYFGSPSQDLQPSIWAIKSQLSQYSQRGALEYYLDLHAHANRKGVFVYGNSMDGSQALESLLYSRLVALNSPVFDFQSCNFTEQNMSKPDKDGGSKEGAGRVALFRETGLTHLYTVEANYNSARILNVVSSATGKHNGRASPPNTRRAPPRFTADILQASGRAFLIAALDMRNANPWSRLPNSEYHSLQGLRSWLSTCMRSPPETRVQHLPALSDATILPVLAEAKASKGNPPWQSTTSNSSSTRAHGGGTANGSTFSAAGGVGWVVGAGQSRGSRRAGDQVKPPSSASARRVVSFGRTQLLPDFGTGPSAGKPPGSAASAAISNTSMHSTPAGKVHSSAASTANHSTTMHSTLTGKAPGSAASSISTHSTLAGKPPGSATSTATGSTSTHSNSRLSTRLGSGTTVGQGHRIGMGQDRGRQDKEEKGPRGANKARSALEVEGRGSSASGVSKVHLTPVGNHLQQQQQQQQHKQQQQQGDEASWVQGAHPSHQHSMHPASHGCGLSSSCSRERRLSSSSNSSSSSSSSGGGGGSSTGVAVGGSSDSEKEFRASAAAENELIGGWAGCSRGRQRGWSSPTSCGERGGGVRTGRVNIGEGCEESGLLQCHASLHPCALQDGVLSEYPGQSVAEKVWLKGGWEGDRDVQLSARSSHSPPSSPPQLPKQKWSWDSDLGGTDAARHASPPHSPVATHTLPAPPTLEQPGCVPHVMLPPSPPSQQHQPTSPPLQHQHIGSGGDGCVPHILLPPPLSSQQHQPPPSPQLQHQFMGGAGEYMLHVLLPPSPPSQHQPQASPQLQHCNHQHQHHQQQHSQHQHSQHQQRQQQQHPIHFHQPLLARLLQPANESQGGSHARSHAHPHPPKSPQILGTPPPTTSTPLHAPLHQHQQQQQQPASLRQSSTSSSGGSSRHSGRVHTYSSSSTHQPHTYSSSSIGSSGSIPPPAVAAPTDLAQAAAECVSTPPMPQLHQISEQPQQHQEEEGAVEQQQPPLRTPQGTHLHKRGRGKRPSQRGLVQRGSGHTNMTGYSSRHTPSAARGLSLRLDIEEPRVTGRTNVGSGGGGRSPPKPPSPLAKESVEGKGAARLQQLRQGSRKGHPLFVDGRAFQEALEAEQALLSVRAGKRESKGSKSGVTGGKKQASNLRRPSTTRETKLV